MTCKSSKDRLSDIKRLRDKIYDDYFAGVPMDEWLRRLFIIAMCVLLFWAIIADEKPKKNPTPEPPVVENTVVEPEPTPDTDSGVPVGDAVEIVMAELNLEPLGSESGRYIVKRVVDGDTIIVATKLTGDLRVRLAGIDAPEKGQFFGEDASTHLTELLSDKEVKLTSFGKDCFNREIAVVILDGVDINSQMVKDGYAWCAEGASERDYSEDQAKAQEEKKGLWESGTAIPPSLYRRLSHLDDAFVKSILEAGFFLDSNGYLHNGRCDVLKRYRIPRWDGVKEYQNCPRCGGAFFE